MGLLTHGPSTGVVVQVKSEQLEIPGVGGISAHKPIFINSIQVILRRGPS